MIRAAFIGVDKYRDPRVRDLTGAVRDATALWSLFRDSVPELEATLLTDNAATVDGIRLALQQTLGDAVPDDVVLLAFSGHGSRSQRLVAYDTNGLAIEQTTIGMEELAALFARSRARAILCVIDCCFSGGAPGRVFEDSPVSRDPIVGVELLAGEGRILLAACKPDELAYESPAHRHGLLTKAVLETLQEGDSALDITVLAAKVLEKVRAGASKLGVIQTPVLLGHVIGGLTMPRLTPGPLYRAAFPEMAGIKVSAAMGDLTQFGLSADVVNAWEARFKGGLNDLQLSAVNDFRVLDGASLLVVAPTSSGKTFVGELAATRAVQEGRKSVFLLPYRALVNEKYDAFVSLYGEKLGWRVVRCSGDFTDQVDVFVRGKYELALLTFEMFLNVAVSNPAVLNQIGLVVLDEAQFIADPNRGISVELLLAFLLAARERGLCAQLVALSAVIGDINNFDDWLGVRGLKTDYRPVPLIEGVLDRSGQFEYLDEKGEPHLEALLPAHAIRIRREEASAQDVIVPLVTQLLQNPAEQVIVFRNQRGAAQGCAAYLANDLGLPPAAEPLRALPDRDLSTTSATLRRCLQGGAAFHNTNLTRDEKQIVERAFRETGSGIRVLGATTTVAAGINTPASTVIIAEQEFLGEDGRPFTVAEYKNMAGRAGRLGFNEKGRSIILANSQRERQFLFNKYVRGVLEPLRSSFDPADLDTWLLRLLGHINSVPRTNVVHLLAGTYGGYLANRRDPSWRDRTVRELESLLDRMIRLGIVEQEEDAVRLTLLGRACARSTLSFHSAIRLVEVLRQLEGRELTAVQLMGIIQLLPESDAGYTPMFKKGQKEGARVGEATARFDRSIVQLLQRYVNNVFEWYGRCKRAAILYDWISGVELQTIERAYTTTPFAGAIGYGDVRRFADLTRYHLRPAYQIATLIFLDRAPDEASVDVLLKQLEVGIPAELVGLLELPIVLGRGDYLALGANGVRSPEDFWKLGDEEIHRIFGDLRAPAISRLRPGASAA